MRLQPSTSRIVSSSVPASRSRPRRACGHLSTITVNTAGQLVPWLAADGPLAYTPEDPPERDYFFQYSWVLSNMFAEHTNKRRHFYFGAPCKDSAAPLFSFWQAARDGIVQRVLHCQGSIGPDGVTAPLAVYVVPPSWHRSEYLFMQHGSYQLVRTEDQPRLDSGEILLYRGVQNAKAFRLLRLDALDGRRRTTWRRYLAVQAHVLSDAARSFSSIHDRASRCETAHIRDRSWVTDQIARQQGLDIDSDGFGRQVWDATHQSFTLSRSIARYKFGPSYVVCTTPASNVRMTSFFAGEHEVRVIDPRLVEIVETHSCDVEDVSPIRLA